MDERTWAQRLAVIAVLDDPVRRALYEYVAGREQPVGRDEAAEALEVNRSTAAFHLDRLAAEGLLSVVYRRLTGRSGPGAGRPAKLYGRPAGEVLVSVPERRYDLAADLLAAAIERATDSGRPVRETLPEIGREVGRQLGANAGSVHQALERYGFQPRRDETGWVLGNCPFHSLASRYTELVCGLNLDLLTGVAAGAHDDRYDMVLDPGPDRCCVRLARTPSTVDD